MRRFIWGLGLVFVLLYSESRAAACPPTLDFSFRTLAGAETVRLCERYRGKVVLIVNTASRCAYTPQYQGLEALYDKYQEAGFVVLGFPSNDFAGQEPGSEVAIKKFCRLNYGVTFPLFEKVHAAKDNASAFYRTLGDLAGEYPSWNFHKYLLDRDGRLVASFPSAVPPESPQLLSAIEGAL